MTLLLGCLGGVGLLLTAAPFLWPSTPAGTARRPGPIERLTGWLALAGIPSLTPAGFVAISTLCGLALGVLLQAVLAVVALSAAAAVVGLALPAMAISARLRARQRANRAIWPDAVDQLVSAVRSGLALPDSVSSLAHTGPTVTREAFAGFERDYRATGNFSRSVDALKDRLADPVADRILETLRMAREVGGTDLTLVLRNLAIYLREESAIRSEVEARQSWVTNAARLGVAAPWLVLLLLASRPEAAHAYNSATGITVILVGLVVSVLAYRVMRALGRLPRERRWFR